MLHHLSPLGEILRMIVSRTDLIALVMRQLPLDPVLMEAHLMKQSGGDTAEAVNCGPAMIPHSIERIEHRVVRAGFKNLNRTIGGVSA